jgi:hypothetical protein
MTIPSFLKLFTPRRIKDVSVEFEDLKTKFVAFANEVTIVLTDKDAQITSLRAQIAAAPVIVQDPSPADVVALSTQIDAALAALPAPVDSATGGPIHPNLV